jgi:hypothetical protein
MRRAGYVARMGEIKKIIRDLVGTVKDKLISRCLGGRILLKRISQTDVRVQTGFV